MQVFRVDMRAFLLAAVAAGLGCSGLGAQDARQIVRKSVELDLENWLRMKDYTWTAHETERRLDSKGQVKSMDSKTWETIVLYGEPHRRILERNGQPLRPDEEQKQQRKLDEAVAKLEKETPEERERRIEKDQKERQKARDFLNEVADLYDFRMEGTEQVDGHEAWVISAKPRPGYQPKRRDAKPLLKIQGKIWIDKAEYQWVRLQAETTGVISYGLFLARLNPGAKLMFEQTRINDEIWLPIHEMMSGSGRLGLLKKLSLQQDLRWSNYRKFQVDSKIVSADN